LGRKKNNKKGMGGKNRRTIDNPSPKDRTIFQEPVLKFPGRKSREKKTVKGGKPSPNGYCEIGGGKDYRKTLASFLKRYAEATTSTEVEHLKTKFILWLAQKLFSSRKKKAKNIGEWRGTGMDLQGSGGVWFLVWEGQGGDNGEDSHSSRRSG